MTVLDNAGGVTIGRFPDLEAIRGLRAFISTRLGGVSAAPFDSLNVGLKTEDDPACVHENRRRLLVAAGIDPGRLVIPRQVHSDRVVRVASPGMVPDTDACFTDCTDLFLTVSAADCVPVLWVHPKRRIVGIIHAGWRGARKRIAAKAVGQACDLFQCDPSEVVAVIGPAVSQPHYEVGEDVAEQFEAEFVDRSGAGKPCLDLPAVVRRQLEQASVGRIVATGWCTVENHELFYSHRGSGGRCGRMMGLIGLSSN